MSSNTVVLFGAGATRACGGPLTNEILPKALSPTVRLTIERESYIYLVDLFLVEIFYLPPQSVDRKAEDYPALPLLLSLIDKAINSNQPMGPNWPVDKLRQVRRGLQYLIFALLEYMLRQFDHNYYADLFQALDPSGEKPPTVISLNYDIIVDNALMRHTKKFPDYGCDIATESYKRRRPKRGLLLKIHGSLNWSYCPGCSRLDLGVVNPDNTNNEPGSTYKMLNELYQENPLEPRYSCQGFACPQCQANVEPVLITPTQMKDYRNPHVMRVWHLAEQALRNAERLYIVGYSLPDDDLDVIYLLKRSLGQLANSAPQNITVVENTDNKAMQSIRENPVGRRYRSIFGPHIDWHTDGFKGLVSKLNESRLHPG